MKFGSDAGSDNAKIALVVSITICKVSHDAKI